MCREVAASRAGMTPSDMSARTISAHLLEGLRQARALAEFAALGRRRGELLGGDLLALFHAQALAQRARLLDRAGDPLLGHHFSFGGFLVIFWPVFLAYAAACFSPFGV